MLQSIRTYMSLGAGTVLSCHMSSRPVSCELVRCTLSLVRRREVVTSEGGSVEETHGVDAYNYLQRFLVCSCLRCQHGAALATCAGWPVENT